MELHLTKDFFLLTRVNPYPWAYFPPYWHGEFQ